METTLDWTKTNDVREWTWWTQWNMNESAWNWDKWWKMTKRIGKYASCMCSFSTGSSWHLPYLMLCFVRTFRWIQFVQDLSSLEILRQNAFGPSLCAPTSRLFVRLQYYMAKQLVKQYSGPLSKCEDHLVVAVFRVNKKTEHQHVQNRPSKCYFTHLCKYNIDWAHIAAPFFFPPRFYKNACLSFACPWTDLDFQPPPRIIPLLGVICAIYMYPLSWFQTTCPRRFYRGFSGRCIILFRMPSFRYLINSNNIL